MPNLRSMLNFAKSINAQTLWSCLTLRNVHLLFHLPFFTTSIRQCPICSGTGSFEYKNTYTPLERCVDCGHVYAVKLPKQRILNLMYGDFAYWISDKSHQGITEIQENDQWAGFLEARMGIMEKTGVLDHERPLHVYEIGCSEGMLLKKLGECGHNARGCEMNKPVAEQGIQRLGVDIDISTFEEASLPKQYYDLVISFHTLEHLKSPRETLARVARILKPDGKLLIEVPCGEEEYENRDHLHFFSEESLKKLLDTYFEEVEIIPNCYKPEWCPESVVSLYGIGKVTKRFA